MLPCIIEKVKLRVVDTEDAPFYREILESFKEFYENTGAFHDSTTLVFQDSTTLVFYGVADAISC